MALRKAIAYSHKKEAAYTRKSRVKSKNYVKAIPPSKIVKFMMGEINKFNRNEFQWIVELKTLQNVQIRDNALEASRQHVHRELELAFKGNYYFKVCCYPHHILRENKMLTGAGADRLQSGMTHAFGVPVGIAAQIKRGSNVMFVAVSTQKDAQIVRDIFNRVKAKLPCSTQILMSKTADKK
jgi:large subunit ribosomal protein L10e